MSIQSRILIADNDEANVQLLTDICQAENLEVLVAQDGAETLARIHEEHPDLVLLDVMMPQLDGFEVLQKLRDQPSTRALPVILVTAVSDDDSIRRGYQLGANDYITKPFKVAELISRMSSLIKAAAYQRLTQGFLQWAVGDRKSLAASLSVLDESTLPLSLILFQLHNLDQIAQEHTRATALLASQEIASRMRLHLRGVDSAHLLEPDLLALVLVATDAEGASSVARRLEAITEAPVRLNALQIRFEASWAAVTSEERPAQTEQLIQQCVDGLTR